MRGLANVAVEGPGEVLSWTLPAAAGQGEELGTDALSTSHQNLRRRTRKERYKGLSKCQPEAQDLSLGPRPQPGPQ